MTQANNQETRKRPKTRGNKGEQMVELTGIEPATS